MSGQFGRYRLLGEVGRGATSVVYRAEDTHTGHLLALKRLTGDGERRIAQAKRDAARLVRLEHPGIAFARDTGTVDLPDGPAHYLTMLFHDGGTLAERLPALDRRQRLEVLADVADTVGRAHSVGVVHGSLGPRNVLFDTLGRPVVSDFGLARALDARQLNACGVESVAYLAPEQVGKTGDRVGPASDVWALGVMLHEAIAGDRPFTGPTALAVTRRVLDAEPPTLRDDGAGALQPTRRAPGPGTPTGDVAAIVRTALSKHASRRYRDASALAADLRRHLAGEPIRGRAAPRLGCIGRRLRRNPRRAAAAVVVLTLAALGGLALLRHQTRAGALEAARLEAKAAYTAGDWPAVIARAAERKRAEATAVERPAPKTGSGFEAALDELAAALEAADAARFRADADPGATRAELETALERLEALRAPTGASTASRARLAMLAGVCRHLLGDLPQARQDFRRAIALDARSPAVRQAYGELLLRRAVLAAHAVNAERAARGFAVARPWLVRAHEELARARPAGGGSDQDDRDDLDAQVVRCLALVVDGEQAEAVEQARRALERHGERPNVERLLMILATAGNKSTTRIAWRRWAEVAPWDAAARLLRATLRHQAKDVAGATRDLQAALRIEPDNQYALFMRALVRMDASAHREAIADLSRIRTGTLATYALGLRGVCWLQLGQLERGRRDIEAAFDQARGIERSQALFNRAILHTFLGDHERVIEDLVECIRLEPRHFNARIRLAAARIDGGKFAEADAGLVEALRIEPDNARAHAMRGEVALLTNRLDQAAPHFERALARQPTLVEAILGRGELRRRTGDEAGALADFGRALTIRPGDAQALWLRHRLHKSKGRFAEALTDLDRLVEVAPRHGRGWASRAAILTMLGRRREALEGYERALEEPSEQRNWQTWFRYGMALSGAGRHADALQALERAKLVAPAVAKPTVELAMGGLRARLGKQK